MPMQDFTNTKFTDVLNLNADILNLEDESTLNLTLSDIKRALRKANDFKSISNKISKNDSASHSITGIPDSYEGTFNKVFSLYAECFDNAILERKQAGKSYLESISQILKKKQDIKILAFNLKRLEQDLHTLSKLNNNVVVRYFPFLLKAMPNLNNVYTKAVSNFKTSVLEYNKNSELVGIKGYSVPDINLIGKNKAFDKNESVLLRKEFLTALKYVSDLCTYVVPKLKIAIKKEKNLIEKLNKLKDLKKIKDGKKQAAFEIISISDDLAESRMLLEKLNRLALKVLNLSNKNFELYLNTKIEDSRVLKENLGALSIKVANFAIHMTCSSVDSLNELIEKYDCEINFQEDFEKIRRIIESAISKSSVELKQLESDLVKLKSMKKYISFIVNNSSFYKKGLLGNKDFSRYVKCLRALEQLDIHSESDYYFKNQQFETKFEELNTKIKELKRDLESLDNISEELKGISVPQLAASPN